MRYIEATSKYDTDSLGRSIFMAGGITGCPNWQQEMRQLLSQTERWLKPAHSYSTVLNPRRENFPIGDPGAALEQIRWEHDALRASDAILFWFPKETICPIVLYELGAWSMTDKPIFVGVDPEYSRCQDVEIQTRLVRPEVQVVYSIIDLADQTSRSS